MFERKNGSSSSRASLTVPLTLLALAAVGACTSVGVGDGRRSEPQALLVLHAPGDLEHAFWACDYVGTTYGVSAAPVAFCSETTSALLQQNFGGDFDQMLAWWRQNKVAQHARLQATAVKNVAAK